jgi:hypothetical protein
MKKSYLIYDDVRLIFSVKWQLSRLMPQYGIQSGRNIYVNIRNINHFTDKYFCVIRIVTSLRPGQIMTPSPGEAASCSLGMGDFPGVKATWLVDDHSPAFSAGEWS